MMLFKDFLAFVIRDKESALYEHWVRVVMGGNDGRIVWEGRACDFVDGRDFGFEITLACNLGDFPIESFVGFDRENNKDDKMLPIYNKPYLVTVY